MNKILIMLLCAFTFFPIGVATAASKAVFTCEKIKDKATRASCIEDRVENEKAEAADKEKANDLDNFVHKSKEALTRNYLDPSAAQFSNLLVVEDTKLKSRFLCGSVNGKNSYGGYIGALMFYVKWSNSESSQPEIVKIWTDGDSERAQKQREQNSRGPANSYPRYLEAQEHGRKSAMYENMGDRLGAMEICTENYSEYANYSEMVGKEEGIVLTQDQIKEQKINSDIKRSYRKYLRVR